MKSTTPYAQCTEGVFQIQSSICDFYTPGQDQQEETELNSTFQTSEQLTSRTNLSIILKTG